jgi:hypothetical protein
MLKGKNTCQILNTYEKAVCRDGQCALYTCMKIEQ